MNNEARGMMTEPVIYIDHRGELISRVSAEQVEAVLGPHIDAIRKRFGMNATPINAILYCPSCGLQHIDRPKSCDAEHCQDGCACPGDCLAWGNPPHRSHLCAECGNIWRPADVPTNGVATLLTIGKADNPVIAGRANA